MTTLLGDVPGRPPKHVDGLGVAVAPPLDGVTCWPIVNLARPRAISLDGVPGCPPECIERPREVPLDGGGGDVGPRFSGPPEPPGGPLFIPPPGAFESGVA